MAHWKLQFDNGDKSLNKQVAYVFWQLGKDLQVTWPILYQRYITKHNFMCSQFVSSYLKNTKIL